MNLQQLLFVVETAKRKSINKAAKALHTSQPNLSKAIISLEEELNVTLFARTKQGVALTEDGMEFIRYAKALLAQFDEMKRIYERRNSSLPIIRVSTSRMSYVVKALLNCYNTHLIGSETLKIYYRETSPQNVHKDIIEGVSDIAVVSIYGNTVPLWKKIFDGNSIEYKLLYKCSGHMLLNKKHPLLKKKKITIKDIAKYPLIQTFEGNTELPNLDSEIESLHYKDFPKIIYAGARAVLHSLLHKTDAVFFCVTDADVDIFYPDVVSVPLTDIIPGVTWEHYLLKRKNKQMTKEELWFIDSLHAVVEDYKQRGGAGVE